MNRRHLVVSTAVLTTLLGTYRAAIAQSATPAASPETCPTSTAADNTALARRWYEVVLSGHDLTALDAIVLPTTIHESPSFQSVEDSRVVVNSLLTAFPDMTAGVEQTIAEGDFVTVRWIVAGTHTGDYLGLAPTGLPISVTGINIFRFECGRIAEVWSEADLLSLFRQLGVSIDMSGSSAVTPTS